MGNKSLCGKRKDSDTIHSIEELLIKNEDFPLKFEIELKRIKGINLKVKDIFLEFDFFGFKKIRTKIIYNTQTPKWKIIEKFEYVVKNREDLKKILLIKLYNKNNKYLGNISVSFYQMALGTIRNNFVFNSSQRYIGRLQFDVKILQRIDFKFELEKLNVIIYDIYKKYSITNFNDLKFQIYLDANNSEQKTSEMFFKTYSEKIEKVKNYKFKLYNLAWENFDYDKLNYKDILEGPVDLDTSLSEELKYNEQTHKKILAIDSNNELELDEVKTLNTSTNKILQNKTKKIKPNEKQKQKLKNKTSIDENYETIKLVFKGKTNNLHNSHIIFKLFDTTKKYLATGYLPLDSFFHHKGNLIETNKNFYNSYKINIWKYGHYVGRLDVSMILKYDYFLRQNNTGIRTEEGTFFSSDILPFKKMMNSHSKSYDSELIKMFRFYKAEIKELIFEDNKIVDDEILETVKVLKDLKKNLKKKLQDSTQDFNKENEILEFQYSLLDLIIILTKLFKDIDLNKIEKKLAYDSLKIMMEREELNFNFVPTKNKSNSQKFIFEKAGKRKLNEHNFFNNKSLKKLKRKKEVLFEFIKLLERLLEYFEIKIQIEEHDNHEIDLLSFLMVQFYLKNKTYQENLLINFEKIIKEKGIIFQNYTFNNNDKFELFLSNKNLFSLLKKDEEAKKKIKKLKDLFSNQKIYIILTTNKKYITNKFIQKLLNYYNEEFIVRKHLNWNNLFGYNLLVHFIYYEVHELKNLLEIEENNLKEAVLATISNNFQLNLFLPLLITKTNIRDPQQLDIFYELIAYKFNSIILKQKKIIINLDYHFFIELLVKVLNEEHLISMEKTILLLYKYSSIFGKQFRELIFEYFCVNDHFYRFFLHWSVSIRKIFYYFLIFNFNDDSEIFAKINKKLDIIKKNLKYYNSLRIIDRKKKSIENKRKKVKIIKKINLEFDEKLLVYTNRSINEYNKCFSAYKKWIEDSDPFKNKDTIKNMPDLNLKVFKDGSEF